LNPFCQGRIHTEPGFTFERVLRQDEAFRVLKVRSKSGEGGRPGFAVVDALGGFYFDRGERVD
jgi:hypothetical protein